MSDRNLTDLRRPLTLDTARPEPTTHRVDRPSLNEVVWLPTRELDAMDIALLDEIAPAPDSAWSRRNRCASAASPARVRG